jgi:hypothetical protein
MPMFVPEGIVNRCRLRDCLNGRVVGAKVRLVNAVRCKRQTLQAAAWKPNEPSPTAYV